MSTSGRCAIDEAADRSDPVGGSKHWRTHGMNRFAVEKECRNQQPLSEIA